MKVVLQAFGFNGMCHPLQQYVNSALSVKENFKVCISLQEFVTVCPVKSFVITLGHYMLLFPFLYYLC